jgi:hypothetical protein
VAIRDSPIMPGELIGYARIPEDERVTQQQLRPAGSWRRGRREGLEDQSSFAAEPG